MDRQSQIQSELEKAEHARLLGNEGRARVCARRAAGIAARDYLVLRRRVPRTLGAYDLLRLLAEDSELKEEIKQAAAYLTLRVGEDFRLSVDVDLIVEAKKLCAYLSEVR
jgi:HEPN domain-containing protein